MIDNVLTPVGRMVQGDLFVAQRTDMKGRPLIDKKGQPYVKYFFAIAISKSDPGLQPLIATIQQAAQTDFPGGQWQSKDFAWKYSDGDAAENNGKEGFAGCMVFKISSGFPPNIWETGGTARIVEPGKPKRGDYIRAVINIKGNGSPEVNAGMYLNHQLVEFVGYGPEIFSGPDGAEVFSKAPAATLPVGASPTPVAGTPLATSTGVKPAHDFVSPTPGGPPGPPTPPAPAGPVMTAKAGGFTYEQMIAAGWDDEKLKAHGYIE